MTKNSASYPVTTTGTNFDYDALVRFLRRVHEKNINARWGVGCQLMPYTKAVSPYNRTTGGVFAPSANRIYLIPYYQGTTGKWHYIDCTTSQLVEYMHYSTVVSDCYSGGVFVPLWRPIVASTINAIYMIPFNQATAATWHYIAVGGHGSIVAYTHGATCVNGAYGGGVYSPNQGRVYMVPYVQATATVWHYIDGSNGSVVAYTHGATAVASAYYGGVYSPTQDRIYMIPSNQATATVWHYINCTNGSVVAYTHGATAVSGAYRGGVWSPIQNRIYMAPGYQSTVATWHYIDCNNGSVVAYTHGATAVSEAYAGGAYTPTGNRIHFGLFYQAEQPVWHYIDCSNGSVVAYTHGSTSLNGLGEHCLTTYDPVKNRTWVYVSPMDNVMAHIQDYSTIEIPSTLAGYLSSTKSF